MKRKRYTHEQIISLLKAHETGQGVGENTDPSPEVEVRRYGDMEISDARRLRELKQENAQMKRLLAEAELDKVALKTLVQGTW